ncbi:MAG TPA: radical SAM protein [Candidatus Krumholzibacteria bacterium]|nr:radical SAM protein [Candidatus Krumholzibacteria bacterium]HRX51842.1 radical SAM protein [Candidatus Krumholzibacteria bacterium]
MDHVGRIFRPPSEARSLLLQVTVGCSWNRCTYCAMYRDEDQRFRVKPWETVLADLDEAAAAPVEIRRVFLCDGDALILAQDKLERILLAIRERLPAVRRVGVYGDTRSVLRKSAAELARLRELGLGIVYHGVESGDDATLRRIDKGGTADEAAETAARLREAGIRHSVIVMLGIGGRERSREHAAATADLLTRMDPPYVGALTTTIVPGSPLAREADRGAFALPDAWGFLEELEVLVDRARLTRCAFHANHASNYLPLRLNLPADREKGLALLRAALEARDPSLLVPEGWRGL